MQFTIHADFSSIDPGEWNALLRRSVADTPFLRHEYQGNWWQHRGGGEWPRAQLVLMAARREGQLVGLAPLFLAEHDGKDALLLVGSIEISDYLDLIVSPDEVKEFCAGLMDALVERGPAGWQLLDWYNLPESSPTLAVLKREAKTRGWACTQEVFRPAPHIPLPGDFEAYLAGIGKKQRHEIRRKLRRLEQSGREVRWYISDGAELDEEIETLFVLMAQDPEKAEFLTAAMRAQMRGTVQAAHRAGWLWLACLEVDGQRAAVSLNFDYNDRLLAYNSGVDRAFQDLSPGWVLLSHTLRWANEHHRLEFDFMRGNEDYKYRFGAVDRHVMRLRVVRP
jgi:CelD/BcsL family acetyltransferase involved in cellulose biosynthesis